jgi:hypothetical protein
VGASGADHGGLPRSFERGSLGDLADELVFAPDDIAAVHRPTAFAAKKFKQARASTVPIVELQPGTAVAKTYGEAIRKSKKSSPYGVAAGPMPDLGVVIYLMPPERLSEAHRRATGISRPPQDSKGQEARQ